MYITYILNCIYQPTNQKFYIKFVKICQNFKLSNYTHFNGSCENWQKSKLQIMQIVSMYKISDSRCVLPKDLGKIWKLSFPNAKVRKHENTNIGSLLHFTLYSRTQNIFLYVPNVTHRYTDIPEKEI